MRARVDQGQHEQIVYDFVNEHPVVLNVAIAFFRDDAFADDSTQGKAICARVRALAAVISALDKLIPNPLIFRVYDEDGSPRGVAFNLKEKQFNRKYELARNKKRVLARLETVK